MSDEEDEDFFDDYDNYYDDGDDEYRYAEVVEAAPAGVSNDTTFFDQDEFANKLEAFIKGNDVEGLRQSLEEFPEKGTTAWINGVDRAMSLAARMGHSEFCKILLSNHHNISANTRYAFTPLMEVCSSNVDFERPETDLLKCAELLIDHGVDVNAIDDYSTTALMVAARKGHGELIRFLISRGADVNMADNDGWTALFHAVVGGNYSCVKLLVEAGANLEVTDGRNETAFFIACYKDYKEIAELVKPESERDIDTAGFIKMNEIVTRYGSENLYEMSTGCFPDVCNILDALDLTLYVPAFMDKEVTLFQLLCMDDQKLRDVGVLLSPHRKKILSAVQRFHIHEWSLKSVQYPQPGTPYKFNEVTNIVGNITRQSLVIRATMTYLKLYHKDSLKSCENSQQLLANMVAEISNLNKAMKNLMQYVDTIHQKDRLDVPADLIEHNPPLGKSSKLRLVILTATGTALLVSVFVMRKPPFTAVGLKQFITKPSLGLFLN